MTNRLLLSKKASGTRRLVRRSALGTRAVLSRCAAGCCCDCCWFGDYCQDLLAKTGVTDPLSGTPLEPTGWAHFHNAGLKGRLHFGFEIDSVCDFLDLGGNLKTGTVRLATLRPGTTLETGTYAFDYAYVTPGQPGPTFGLPVNGDRCTGRLAIGHDFGTEFGVLPWEGLALGSASTRYDWAIDIGEQSALARAAHRWGSPYGPTSTEPPAFGYTRHPLLTPLVFDDGGALPDIFQALGALTGPLHQSGCPGFGLRVLGLLERLFKQYLAPFPGYTPIGAPDPPNNFFAWFGVWPDGTGNPAADWEMWRALLTGGNWLVSDAPGPGLSGFEIEISNGSDLHPEVGRIELDVAWRRIGEAAAAFPFQGEARIRATMRLEVTQRCDGLPVLPDGWSCAPEVPRVLATACDGSGETIVLENSVAVGGGWLGVPVTLPGGAEVIARRCFTKTSVVTEAPPTAGVTPLGSGAEICASQECERPWAQLVRCSDGAVFWVSALELADRPEGADLADWQTSGFSGCARVTGVWTDHSGEAQPRVTVQSIAWAAPGTACDDAFCTGPVSVYVLEPCVPSQGSPPQYIVLIEYIAANGGALPLMEGPSPLPGAVVRARHLPTNAVWCFRPVGVTTGTPDAVLVKSGFFNCLRCVPPSPDPPITDPPVVDPPIGGFDREAGGGNPNAARIERHMAAGVPCVGCG